MKFFERAPLPVAEGDNDNDRSGILPAGATQSGETTKVFDMSKMQALDKRMEDQRIADEKKREEALSADTTVFSLEALKRQRQDFYRSSKDQQEVADLYEQGQALEKLDPMPEPGSRIRVTRVVSMDADRRAEWRAFADAMYQTRRLEEERYKPGPFHDVTTPQEQAAGMQLFARSEQPPIQPGSAASDRYLDIATEAEKRQGMEVFARAPGTMPEPIEDLTEFAELDEEEDARQHQEILAKIMNKTDEIYQKRVGPSPASKKAA